jgi:hypothetical protein
VVHRTVRCAPDCPVCTRLCLVPRLAQRRTRCSRESPRALRLKFTGLSGEPTALAPTVGSEIDAKSTGDAWPEPTITRPHRTVQYALDSVWCSKWVEGSMVGFTKEGKKSCTVHVRWCTKLFDGKQHFINKKFHYQ